MTESVVTIAVQEMVAPVMVHLSPEHGTMTKISVNGSPLSPWAPGTTISGVAMGKSMLTIPSKTTVQISFIPLNEAQGKLLGRMPFRTSTMTGHGPVFGLTFRANIAPQVPTVVALSPYFNRVSIMPWFMIGVILMSLVLLAIGLACCYVDRSKGESMIVTRIDAGYIYASYVMIAISLGFLAFWSTVQGYQDSRPRPRSC